jgi:glycerol-3-phosphate dehydrogenase
MQREHFLQQISANKDWDIIIIGGGATGLGIAVDAAARRYRVVLLEQSDFGKGTSSRSTKLIHGGVRYLRQGRLGLVKEALRERALLRRNAPHLVRDLSFLVPSYRWWEAGFYGAGLKVYDWLAGREGFGNSQRLSRKEALERVPTLRPESLRGGILYHDGQFDDSRLLVNLAQTAAQQGACLLNYAPAVRLLNNASARVAGVEFHDLESGRAYELHAACVINATGPFCDELRRQDDPRAEQMITLSQGAHVVLPQSFLPGNTALMVPQTPDGRVMFAIPWHGQVIVGTTDSPISAPALEPRPTRAEVEFILQTAGEYLSRRPRPTEILSVFAGIRPLVDLRRVARTAKLSREHTITMSPSGLITITGGKWTTYRQMAEDCVDQAIVIGGLAPRPCSTGTLGIHGSTSERIADEPLAIYGSDAAAIEALARENPSWQERLHPDLPIRAAQVIWAVRKEMARTVDDVLARRTRALFLNARAAMAMAPAVARLMAAELGRDTAWQERQLAEFREISRNFLLEG